MMANEQTGPQLIGQVGIVASETLPKTMPSSVTYQTYRDMRKDPTIALARWLVVAPVLAAPWSVEAKEDAPDGAQDFINDQVVPYRAHILRTSFYANIDYGWQGYEKVFEVLSDGMIGISKLKPLLQDITDILIDEKTGAYAGLAQDVYDVKLRTQESLLISLDVEGTDWYGQPLMENVRSAQDDWQSVTDAANRYDKKVAGSTWVVHYPIGVSKVNGVSTNNYDVAVTILGKLESSGAIAIPRRVEGFVDSLNKDSPDAWKIELVGDGSPKQYSFTNRLGYLDSLKVRGLGLPERAVLEGQFGTKAEAEAHADFAITNMELRHQQAVQHVNWHLVDQLLRINYGSDAEGTVYIEPAPITDNALMYLREIYAKILESPDWFLNELDTIDVEALKDRVGIPIKPDVNIDLPGVTSPVEPPSEEDEE
jgi:hypothetical protein